MGSPRGTVRILGVATQSLKEMARVSELGQALGGDRFGTKLVRTNFLGAILRKQRWSSWPTAKGGRTSGGCPISFPAGSGTRRLGGRGHPPRGRWGWTVPMHHTTSQLRKFQIRCIFFGFERKLSPNNRCLDVRGPVMFCVVSFHFCFGCD